MATDVIMPQMGESIFEGTITKWLKKPGDKVQRDEPLFEISTDKVDAEIPAPASGVLREIKVGEGNTVQVNTVVGVIDADGAGASAAPAAHKAAPAKSEAAKPEPAKSTGASKGGAAATDGAAAKTGPTSAPQPRAAKEVIEFPAEEERDVRSSPLVRRLARENNINLEEVSGTGAGGRVTKEDIQNYLQNRGAQPERRPAAAAAAPQAAAGAAAPAIVPGEIVAMSAMRKKIAERMVESKRTSPHVHTVYEVDMTRVAQIRERNKKTWEQRNGTRLTFMSFIARATVAAIQQHPIVNSSVEGDNIHYHRNINLGIAVALDWGLIVPVVRRAEELNFLGLQRAVNDLSERARTKRLAPDDVAGGTFTITNPGSIGGLFGLPIIMQPQVAILGIGGIVKTPVVISDEEGTDSIAIRSMMHAVLGYDHRIIDGAVAGQFLGTFKRFLETWSEDIG
ncbi:MAG TPA: 2-oxoglutarate dehydrogenase, E2 component, dihydrolipoamide succinyltransferase [Terriglobales bacterium]|nr:2-oxoglutarate dehydrogenase, E2 component, dihydrolipoamide succinyltransferase [Terriglobales bacterium]